MVDDQRRGGFKLLRGFRFQFLATYGEHSVKIWTNDRQHLLAMRAVVVNPPETESRVVLEIPRRQLGPTCPTTPHHSDATKLKSAFADLHD